MVANEVPEVEVTVNHWRLEKFEGDPPHDGKLPIEVIEGGDGLPTVHSYPQEADEPAILPFPYQV